MEKQWGERCRCRAEKRREIRKDERERREIRKDEREQRD